VEALVRWNHPERGLLGPSEFVALAEDTGLIVPIGRWVMHEACRRAKGWQQSHTRGTPLTVIVNFSAKQLRHPGCVGHIEEALGRSGLEARLLGLDVTESVFIDAFEVNTLALQRIEDLGVGLSIDDFGTGYSSLSYLKRLPAGLIKVDRAFVRGLGEDAEDTAIVRMVIDLAHTLGMKVVAEGVESEGQAALLEKMGCDMAQGFHFARPLPPEAVPEVLSAGWRS
jgi:EAL domain-containing protein (putative c-di-GMP-specific phosphodiesterase class I)